MKKTLIILILAILIGAGIWWFFINDREDDQADVAGPQDFPAVYEVGDTAPTERYESPFTNLAFSYPNNWNVLEGAENSAEGQLVTAESPLDENEFYFCLDFNIVSDESAAAFAITDAEVLAVNPLDSGYTSVIYRVEGLDGLQWGVTSEDVAIGDSTFTSEIANGSSYTQVYGRFDCRATNKRGISLDEFQNSRWFHEAQGIVNSLEF